MNTNNHYYRLLLPVILAAAVVVFLWTQIGKYTAGLLSEKSIDFSMIVYIGLLGFIGGPLLANVINRFQKMKGALNKVKTDPDNKKHKDDFFSFLRNGLHPIIYMLFEALVFLILVNIFFRTYSSTFEGCVVVGGISTALFLFLLMFVEIEDVFGGCWCFDTSAMPKDWQDEVVEFQRQNKIMTRQKLLNWFLKYISRFFVFSSHLLGRQSKKIS